MSVMAWLRPRRGGWTSRRCAGRVCFHSCSSWCGARSSATCKICRRASTRFCRGRPARAELRNWCVITEGDGHETWHVHQNGWLSGVFYPYVQDHIAQGTGVDGCIAFGLPEGIVGEENARAFGEVVCRPRNGVDDDLPVAYVSPDVSAPRGRAPGFATRSTSFRVWLLPKLFRVTAAGFMGYSSSTP